MSRIAERAKAWEGEEEMVVTFVGSNLKGGRNLFSI